MRINYGVNIIVYFLGILGIGISYHERNIKKQFEELKNETRELKKDLEEIKNILSRN